VIRLYEDHATSEQFHSEIKSYMDMERLPSGKFATNALILTLAGLAHNILRFIGQLGLVGDRSPLRHPAKRRCIKAVITGTDVSGCALGHNRSAFKNSLQPTLSGFRSLRGYVQPPGMRLDPQIRQFHQPK